MRNKFNFLGAYDPQNKFDFNQRLAYLIPPKRTPNRQNSPRSLLYIYIYTYFLNIDQ